MLVIALVYIAVFVITFVGSVLFTRTKYDIRIAELWESFFYGLVWPIFFLYLLTCFLGDRKIQEYVFIKKKEIKK